MPSLKLYTSNKLELLLEALSEVVKSPHASPFSSEIIVVQNKGIQHWVSMQLCVKLKVWANSKFLFPNSFVEEIFSQCIVDYAPCSSKDLVWGIMDALPKLIKNPEFGSLKNYLKDGRQMKLYQLSSQIADVFDQYSIYRPAMVLDWEKGRDETWQAVLWRSLFANSNLKHRAKLRENFFAALKKPETLINKGSWSDVTRISFFGISSLPPFHVEIVNALSTLFDIHIFLLNPCRDYWDDILSEKEIHKIIRKKGKRFNLQSELHWDKGNSLLSSFGGYGRDFIGLLHGLSGEEFSLASEPSSQTLLSCIQSDILNLRERGSQANVPTMAINSTDNSVQIHSCHSPMREMEVLYDNLLKLFQNNPDLRPCDIVVMTPEIELYASTINAVFGTAENERLRLPYSIADCGLKSGSSIIETYFSMLDLLHSRFTASEVLSILEFSPVLKAFNLSDADIDVVRSWISKTNIRWGLNEETFSDFKLPLISENSWKAGLQSMLLGYAVAPEKEKLSMDSIFPFNEIEGTQARVLGNFLDFMDQLDVFHKQLSVSHRLCEWSEILLNLLKRFFLLDDEKVSDLKILCNCLVEVSEIEVKTGYSDLVDLELITNHLTHALSSIRYSSGFISGAITFCEMLPMRSIPFKVICLVGINDTSFPRRSRHVAWDLMSTHPQKGDRSLEKEDRYIYLEALCSARDVFYISYTGQDVKDNSTRPPSVLVTELLDYIDKGFTVDSNIHIVHKLQAFSTYYFKPLSPLQSFSKENFSAAQSMVLGPKTKKPFFCEAIPSPFEPNVTLDSVCNFFKNPIRYSIQKNLGITFDVSQMAIVDNEPFAFEGLSAYGIGQELVEDIMNGKKPDSCLSDLINSGSLPHGDLGKAAFATILGEALIFSETIKTILHGSAFSKKHISGHIGEFDVSGTLSGYSESRLVHYRFAHAKAKDKIVLWLEHCALLCFEKTPVTSPSILISRDGVWETAAMSDPLRHFEKILDLYRSGLSKPLAFFPETSLAFAEAVLLDNKDLFDARRLAQKAWLGDDYSIGEIRDPYLSFCFEHDNPLDEEFEEVALEVYKPILIKTNEL